MNILGVDSNPTGLREAVNFASIPGKPIFNGKTEKAFPGYTHEKATR